MAQAKDYWTDAARKLEFRTAAFVDGRTVSATDGATYDHVNPATNVARAVMASDAEIVNQAVAAARRSFESGVWSRMHITERGRRLVRFARLLHDNAEELALLETVSVGKPISDSLNVDLPLTIRCLEWFGEAIDKIYEEIAPTRPGVVALMRRAPLGVVAAVVPWNFPLLMAMWKIAPILAGGNSMVLKPAEQSPFSALRIAELAIEAGIPEGVFNVVPGLGHVAGRALGLHMDVDAVTFTGSTDVGKRFMEYSGQSNLKRVSLECGGKSPQIILADAPDLDAAATAAAWGIFYNQGEVCNAGSRLVVEASVKDRVLEKIIEIGRGFKVGDPLDPETQMGPLVDRAQHDRVTGYIRKGVAEGARLVLGDEAASGDGCFVRPTVFDQVDRKMIIAQEEIFGPVLSTLSVNSVDEAIAVANDSIFGLAAGVWTSNINTAFKVSEALCSGIVWVNSFDVGEVSTPFGGFKQSGFGRDKSIHAIDKYTDVKLTWIQLS